MQTFVLGQECRLGIELLRGGHRAHKESAKFVGGTLHILTRSGGALALGQQRSALEETRMIDTGVDVARVGETRCPHLGSGQLDRAEGRALVGVAEQRSVRIKHERYAAELCRTPIGRRQVGAAHRRSAQSGRPPAGHALHSGAARHHQQVGALCKVLARTLEEPQFGADQEAHQECAASALDAHLSGHKVGPHRRTTPERLAVALLVREIVLVATAAVSGGARPHEGLVSVLGGDGWAHTGLLDQLLKVPLIGGERHGSRCNRGHAVVCARVEHRASGEHAHAGGQLRKVAALGMLVRSHHRRPALGVATRVRVHLAQFPAAEGEFG
mmetsp:Transcript_34722/g.87298  ORF Transcript_34722/g.87298 Transcript_34722/m.87298 type:complete len:328 (-) Transcript_34722:244-1227(-)